MDVAAGLSVDDLKRFGVQFGQLLAAYAFTLPMAWDREQANRSLGLRTLPLVAVASCAFVLVGQSESGLDNEPQAMSRVLQGIIAGVGFLGGGAIVKQGMTVRGAATAASVWLTAALGVAVADDELGIAAALGFIGFATLRWLGPLKRVAQGRADCDDDEMDDRAASDDERPRSSRRRERPGDESGVY